MKIIVGLTGASGSIYGKRLIESLLALGHEVHLIATETGEKVFSYEVGEPFDAYTKALGNRYRHFFLEDNRDFFSGVASGSHPYDAVIVCPCSMGTLASISNGMSTNLLTRVCDVAIKEKRQLVIVPRETPFSAIHLENLLKLSRLGVSILPAMPGFYHQPETLDDLVNFVVGKLLDHIKIENKLFKKWKEIEK